MPKEYLKCKANLIEQGKLPEEAAEVCAISYYHRHGKTVKEAAKENSLDEKEFEAEFHLVRDVEEYVAEHLEFEDLEMAEKWTAPTARKDVPDSHFLYVKSSETGKGKIKKFPYKNSDGSINCTAVVTAIRAVKGARTGSDLSSKYPGVLTKAQNIYNRQCKKKLENLEVLYKMKHVGKYLTFVKLSEGDKPVALTSKPMTIEILRTGTFKHPVYGKLEITKEKLENMVRNFDNEVLGREISFDFTHNPDIGASAWVDKLLLRERDGVSILCAVIHPTEDGVKAIKGKKYRYFSAEYTENYKDKEADKEHGPTLISGGFTNRPFVPNLQPVALSEDIIDDLKSGDDFEIDSFRFNEIKESADDDDGTNQDDNNQDDNNQDDNNQDDDSTKNLDDDGNQDDGDVDADDSDDDSGDVDADDDKKKLEADDMKDKGTKKAQKPAATKDDLKKLEESFEAKLKAMEDTNTKLSDEKKELGELVQVIMKENKQLKEGQKKADAQLDIVQKERFKSEKELFLQGISARGVPPAIVKTIEAYITMENDTLMIKDKEGKEVSLKEIFQTIVDSMPAGVFIGIDDEEAQQFSDQEKALEMDEESIRKRLKKLNVPLVDGEEDSGSE